MSVYTIDSEGAISAFTDGAEFDAYDADSSKRIKKVTGLQVLSYVNNGFGGVVNTTATTLAVTQAAHNNKVVTISSAAPIAITLPQATGTGAKYRFVLMVAATATGHTIKVANSTDVMQGVVLALTTASANAIGYQELGHERHDHAQRHHDWRCCR